MWSRGIPPSCGSTFIRQQAGMMPRMPPPRIERMYRMVCVALRLYYHSICGTQVRLGPYVFSMRQAFPIQAALAQRKSSRFRYVISHYRKLRKTGLAAHPSGRFDVNGNHFQLAMLAYNLNCWLMLFNREP